MAINFSQQVYLQQQNVFGRPVTFTPPVGLAFVGRGIYGTVAIDIPMEDGSLLSDQRTILDILEEEFASLPEQGWRLTIPANTGMPALGTFEVIDVNTNGGGETTLTLRKITVTKP